MGIEGATCVVTGGCGLVGQRVVELLLERGAAKVVSFDIVGRPRWDALDNEPRVRYCKGDLSKPEEVDAVCEGADCVWHIGALVGPYHPKSLYYKVNYEGTLNVINACRKHKVGKIVMSSSPSTRFTGEDINGKTEAELPIVKKFLEDYAETKAMGEVALRQANDGHTLLTVAIAPHQVYGPRDMLFLPNLLKAAGNGQLRIMGSGENMVSFTHVDNYASALIDAEAQLYPGSAVLGKFYIVTDGDPRKFWVMLDEAVVAMGWPSLKTKLRLPYWLLYPIACIVEGVGALTGRKFKLTRFAVKMLTINRWFKIDAARKELEYSPVMSFEEGWQQTIAWLREEWLPTTRFAKR
mmetsp:Transcript_3287/g.11925  ORF Transcript_3287/g.11925 Transcript_3287/m.11925 type:complete len:352 (+) Transcript_3287:91-1146(+)